jgi:ABC transporter substrate binding protein (PQQ-dependent alcohol dehydrogenase system)
MTALFSSRRDVPTARRARPLLPIRAVVALMAALALAPTPARAATPPTQVKILLISRADDPRLDRDRVERAYFGHPGGPASDAVAMAIRDSKFELDAAAIKLTLTTVSAASAQAAREIAGKAEAQGVVAVLTDLDLAATLAAADATRLPVINLGEADDRLREADCRPRLLHSLPSERMRADALAQTLAAQRWGQVLLLSGPSADDARRAEVARKSIARYGLKIVAAKAFKQSADPRERDLANPRLLTAGSNYDAIWVVDSDGDFARSLPYRSVLPRPVVGDAGLTALAWHPQFERFGAPQVSRRFAKAAGRPMAATDWSAWIAGRAVVGAALASAGQGPVTGKASIGAANPGFARALADNEVDGSKGIALSFRPWDGQLRQPLLLTDGQGVVASAPVDGILHAKNNLDTLGADAPEKLCKSR